jgi:hypothetical protein
MSAAHTPGPWGTREQGEANQHAILSADGNWLIVPLLHNGEAVPERQRANLRRIVACVNACEGLATAAIEADGLGGVARSIAQAGAATARLYAALAIARGALPTESEAFAEATAALLAIQPLVAAITDTTGPEWAERN